MGRGAPYKPGLTYFPKMLDFYDDDRIFDLMDEYGPLGVTIYEVVLTLVYSQGYYAELSKAKLSRMVIRKIGSKWIKGQHVVVQVIDYCAELGLLSKDLLLQNIITSEGIQRRYYEIAVKRMKRQLYSDQYWLLETDKKEEPLLNSHLNGITSEVIQNNSEHNPFTSEEIPMKEKESKDIYIFPSERLEKKFQKYLLARTERHGDATKEQIDGLRERLLSLSDKESDQITILNNALIGEWKSLYPLGGKPVRTKKQQEAVKKKTGNKFNNFQGRDYDMDALEQTLLETQRNPTEGVKEVEG